MDGNPTKMPVPAIKTTRWILAALSFLAGLFFFAFSLLPYGFLKGLADRLSPDGSFTSFTPAFYEAVRIPAALVGLIFLLIGMGLLLFPKPAERGLGSIGRLLSRLKADTKALFRDLVHIRLGWKEGLALLAILITGVVVRVWLLNRPIEYDEAYSFTQFARYPFRVIVSDYSAPNNHVFHTILMRIAYLLLGDKPWQIRLPAFLIGALILVGVYLLGRVLYGKTTGLMAAGILAMLPDFIIRSVSARGYTTVVLMFVLSFTLAAYLVRHKNLFGWCLLSLLSAIGFYSIPIMLYPFCVVYLWLLLSVVDLDAHQYSRPSWIRHVLFSGMLAAALTLFFYSPILLSPRAAQFFHQNNTLHSLPLATFFQILPDRFNSLVTDWRRYLPAGWAVVLLAGLILSLAWMRKSGRFKIPPQLAFTAALGAVLLIQRPGSVTRIWLWIVPLLAIWASAGFLSAIQALPRRPAAVLAVVVPLVVIGGMGINAILFSHSARVNHWGEDATAEEVTLAALPYMTPKTIIVVNQCYDARYWYYFYIHGVPLSAFYKAQEPRPFDRVLALVYQRASAGCGTEPVKETLQMFGPGLNALDLSTLKPVEQVDPVIIYEVLPRSSQREKP